MENWTTGKDVGEIALRDTTIGAKISQWLSIDRHFQAKNTEAKAITGEKPYFSTLEIQDMPV